MGKLKGKRIPRKLKKEFCKIEGWQVQAPMHRSGFHTDPHGRGDSRWDFCSFITRETLKLKDGVKVNKWTRRLIRRLYNEKLKGHRYFAEKIMKNDWSHPNFPDEYYQKMVRSKTSEEFRREYLNEPIPDNNAVFKGLPELGKYSKVRQLDNGLKPGFIIIDDMDDSMPNFRTKQEEMEWIERMKLWHSAMIQPDVNGECFAPKAVLKIKEGAISPEKLEEFKQEWNKQMQSGMPLTLGDEATVEFIPSKRPHRLHNHPRKEMELCAEDEVIVDIEFIREFCWYRPLIDGATGRYDDKHVIVRKNEYRAKVEGSRERERETRILTTYRKKKRYVEEVFSMLSESYQNVEGGLLYRSGEELLSKQNNVWKLLFNSDSERPQVIIIWKDTEFGRKMTACGCTQTKVSKHMLLEELHRDLERGNIWAEVSDKIEHWLNRCDVPRLPFRVAQELLKDKHLIPLGDGYHYTREIQGFRKQKIIFGKINEKAYRQRKSDSRVGKDS